MKSHGIFGALICTTLLGLSVVGCELTDTSGPGSNYNPGNTQNGGKDTTKTKVILTLSPHSASVKTGKTALFMATVTGAADTTVTWTLPGGGGTIAPNGFYTAPASIAGSPMVVVLKATSNADTTAVDSAVITITSVPVDTTVCFATEILPVFQNNCALSGCHDAITREEGYNFSTYQGIRTGISPGNPGNSPAYRQMITKNPEERMPPPPMSVLPAAVIDRFKQWITEGAKNNDCTSGECDTTNVTYSGTVAPIIQNNCLGCHTGSSAYNNNTPLENYAGVKQSVDNGQLFAAIAHTSGAVPMPYGGGMLQDCDIAQIKAWIDKGAPNN